MRFAHKTGTARDTLERFLVTVHVPVRIAIVLTGERPMAHLAGVRFDAGMDSLMLLKVFRIDEGRVAEITLVRSLTSVHRPDVVGEQSAPFKGRITSIALKPFVIQMRHPPVRMKI